MVVEVSYNTINLFYQFSSSYLQGLYLYAIDLNFSFNLSLQIRNSFSEAIGRISFFRLSNSVLNALSMVMDGYRT